MSNVSQMAQLPASRPALGVWIKTARPFSLTAAISPLLVGTAIAANHAVFKPFIFLAALIAGLFLQIGVNYFNEYFDHRYGLDSVESLGASTVIFRNQMTANQVLSGGIGSFAIAAVLGIILIFAVGPSIILFGLAGMAVGYFYSAKPFTLAKRGLGDVFVAISMGFLMTWGAYYVQIQRWSWEVFAASIPVSFLVVAILNMNNLRDYDDDVAVHKKTIVVRFGRPFGKRFHTTLVAGSYAIVTLLAVTHVLPLASLLVWVTAYPAYTHLKTVLPVTDRKLLVRGMPQIALLHLQFGIALAIGLLVGKVG